MKKTYKVISITHTYRGFMPTILKTYSRLSSAEKYLDSIKDMTTDNRWYQIVECDNE
jgi:hypothetical protein